MEQMIGPAVPSWPSLLFRLVAQDSNEIPGQWSVSALAEQGCCSLVAMPGAPSSFLFLVVRPGAPTSVLAPSSDARSP